MLHRLFIRIFAVGPSRKYPVHHVLISSSAVGCRPVLHGYTQNPLSAEFSEHKPFEVEKTSEIFLLSGYLADTGAADRKKGRNSGRISGISQQTRFFFRAMREWCGTVAGKFLKK